MSWHKLVERDDWGSVTVHIGGPVVKGTNLPLEQCPPALSAGEYKVCWPDGQEEILQVVMKRYHVTIGDMGHDYDVSGEKPYFKVNIKGASTEIYAPKLGVEVWREEKQ